MAESRQPTEERLALAFARLREGTEILRTGGGTSLTAEQCNLLMDWAGAQRDVVAAQDRALRRIAAIKDQHTWSEDDALEAAEIAAAVVSGTPERPTRFCGVCGHPSVSAYAGGWKCRDCGAVVSGTPE
jgi:NADH pyrophosphatase NudC (nudix superfamily)